MPLTRLTELTQFSHLIQRAREMERDGDVREEREKQ